MHGKYNENLERKRILTLFYFLYNEDFYRAYNFGTKKSNSP